MTIYRKSKQWAGIALSCLLLISAGQVGADALPINGNPDQAAIHVVRGGTQNPSQGAAEYFTGNVQVDRLFPAGDPLQISGAYVTFEAGARTAWHTHPQGQLLIITAGAGRVQQWGGSVIEVKQGDVVWFPPEVKHWHGAMPNAGMTHIALADIVNGQSVTWMEKVTGE